MYLAQPARSLFLAIGFRMCLAGEVLKGMFPWRTRYPLSYVPIKPVPIVARRLWFGSLRFDSVRFGSIRFDSVRFGSIRLCIHVSNLCWAGCCSGYLFVTRYNESKRCLGCPFGGSSVSPNIEIDAFGSKRIQIDAFGSSEYRSIWSEIEIDAFGSMHLDRIQSELENTQETCRSSCDTARERKTAQT